MAIEETNEVKEAQKAASKYGHRLFRNNRGLFLSLDGKRKVRAGLEAPGASDLIGYARIIVTPEMVGKQVLIALVAEGKKPGWKGVKTETEREQANFINHFNDRGGIGFFFDDGKNVMKLIQEGIDRIIKSVQ